MDNIFLETVPLAYRFDIHDGPIFETVQELLEYMPEMTDKQFAFHVTAKKNDFAQWIEDFHGKGTLSTMMRNAKSKEELWNVLKTRRAEYDRREQDEKQPIEEKLQQNEKGETAPITDDGLFTKVHDRFEEKNEDIGNKFDDLTDAMQESLKNELPDKLAKLDDELKTRQDELRQRLSETRKSGKDTLIAALYMRQYEPKIKLAEATHDPKDFEIVKLLLDTIEQELKEAAAQPDINVKQEVLKLAGIEE
ncbi:MAG: hypothetical protein OXR66_07325 [Candidatus Woesearchaeota archaeon]|nr:hypothetical protein [Candidatus Woesearchaeota archaeon]